MRDDLRAPLTIGRGHGERVQSCRLGFAFGCHTEKDIELCDSSM